jgi:hypothetical protein
MLYLRSINRFILISLALLGLSVSSVNAATFNVVGGEIVGVDGLAYNGQMWDVTFFEGTCVQMLPTCNSNSDNPLWQGDILSTQNLVEGLLGSLRTEFIAQEVIATDVYGLYQPNSESYESIWTISDISSTSTDITARGLCNFQNPSSWYGGLCGLTTVSSLAMSPYDAWTYAEWAPSPVPVPAAVWLFGTALIGLIGFGKRKSRITA